MNSRITTHVLDTSRGVPAAHLKVVLEVRSSSDEWKEIAQRTTDNNGRISDLLPEATRPGAGVYRLIFHTAEYFDLHKTDSFYPYVSVVFEISDPSMHYHVPLLLNPFGYSTYRGQ
jgi:5-hydroxyisourate hydrolase